MKQLQAEIWYQHMSEWILTNYLNDRVSLTSDDHSLETNKQLGLIEQQMSVQDLRPAIVNRNRKKWKNGLPSHRRGLEMIGATVDNVDTLDWEEEEEVAEDEEMGDRSQSQIRLPQKLFLLF